MRSSLLIEVAVAAIATAACSAHEANDFSFDARGDADGDGDDDGAWEGDGLSGGGGSGEGGAGILTAGAWDDNRNYDYFQAYLDGPAAALGGASPFDAEEIGDAHALFADGAPARVDLDVSLVIDTTGSMGDEMSYLKAEYIAITEAIAERFPNASQRWSLVLYRDEGDEYVVRTFDFTANAGAFRDHLAEQVANGGGDEPEAPEQGLAAMNELSWSDAASTARVAFWVADAPYHPQNATAFASAVRDARRLGIHLYPVASSGVGGLAELSMRQAAQLTGGRYLFLTDDSGVGGAHAEPTIPCYYVTKLDGALLRMVEIEMTGMYSEPSAAEILRTGGDPRHGACTLSGGEVVLAF